MYIHVYIYVYISYPQDINTRLLYKVEWSLVGLIDELEEVATCAYAVVPPGLSSASLKFQGLGFRV